MFSQPGQLTVFAPTDDAFAKLNPELRERLMKGQGCVHSVVEHHVLPNVICSTVIQWRARSTSLLGSSLLLERDLEGKLYVNGKRVITRDVVPLTAFFMSSMASSFQKTLAALIDYSLRTISPSWPV